jgi:protein-S-isoprenylcysteine O-methyltransferase Ste14
MIATVALALYFVWLVLAFGLRMLVQLRRTGDTGFRGLSARIGSVEWGAGVLFVVALAACVAAPVLELAGIDPVGLLRARWLRWTGVAVAAAGVLATLAAQLSMGDSWRIGVDETERTDLVTTGAFAMVRNPIYSAMLITASGLTLAVPNVAALAGFVMLVLGVELQVRAVEEPYLLRVHGARYADYTRQTGRFAPRLDRSRP